jgi:hypothetical protein
MLKKRLKLAVMLFVAALTVFCFGQSVINQSFENIESKGAPSKARSTGLNLASGKKYTMSQRPNYALCTEPNDIIQLTDGKISSTGLWTNKLTVGWKARGNVEIIVDLGTVEPICEIILGTLGGAKGNVNFPDAACLVSENGRDFYYVGSRFGSNLKNRAIGYRSSYHFNDLNTKGRYVAIAMISNGIFAFADEIEVIKGDFSAASVKLNGTVYRAGKLTATIDGMRNTTRELAVLRRDAVSVKATLVKHQPALLNKFAKVEKKLRRNKLKKQELAAVKNSIEVINAAIAAKIHPEKSLLIYPGNEWNDFGAFDIPLAGTEQLKSLSLLMGSNEYESTSFIVFNTTSSVRSLTLTASEFKGEHGTIPVGDITLRHSEWVECNDGLMRPDALPLVDGTVPVSPGTNRAFWVTVKTSHTPAGEYRGTVTLNDDADQPETVQVKITVLPVELPSKMPVSTYNWAYLNFAPTKADPAAAVADLAAHYIDTAVIHPLELPKYTFDKQGNIKAKNYIAFDKNIKIHQQAGINKFYFFCNFANISVPNRLAALGVMSSKPTEIKCGTPEWRNAMRSFIVDWVEHLKLLGLGYDDFAFYPFDESSDKTMNGKGKDVLAMFKTADPKTKIFFDPTKKNSVEGMKKFAQYIDIWCPHLTQTLDQKKLEFFAAEQKAGKQVYCYNCQGPDKAFHPLGHYRKMLWLAWSYGLTGVGHWNYADTGWSDKMGRSAWTDFDGARFDFSIIYDSKTAPAHVTKKESIIPSRRWEAWRDGVEDYAYLWMLKRAVENARKSEKKPQAVKNGEAVLKNSVVFVLENPSNIAVYNNARLLLLDAIAAFNN